MIRTRPKPRIVLLTQPPPRQRKKEEEDGPRREDTNLALSTSAYDSITRTRTPGPPTRQARPGCLG